MRFLNSGLGEKKNNCNVFVQHFFFYLLISFEKNRFNFNELVSPTYNQLKTSNSAIEMYMNYRSLS